MDTKVLKFKHSVNLRGVLWCAWALVCICCTNPDDDNPVARKDLDVRYLGIEIYHREELVNERYHFNEDMIFNETKGRRCCDDTGGSFKLFREDMPAHFIDPLIGMGDIENWQRFLSLLEDNVEVRPAVERLREVLEENRSMYKLSSFHFTAENKLKVIKTLNAILDKRDLFQLRHFPDLTIGDPFSRLSNKDQELTSGEIQQLNRQLIEIAFPDIVIHNSGTSTDTLILRAIPFPVWKILDIEILGGDSWKESVKWEWSILKEGNIKVDDDLPDSHQIELKLGCNEGGESYLKIDVKATDENGDSLLIPPDYASGILLAVNCGG
jgi:hypothetical protein